MSFIENNWLKITTVNTKMFDFLPLKFTQDYIQSWNTDNINMLMLQNFIFERRVNRVIECGTFEARFTEMAVRMMSLYNNHVPKTLVTIDLPRDIDHLGDGIVTFKQNKFFDESVRVRHTRLNYLSLYESYNVKVIYKEGLTQLLMPGLIEEHRPDFIYEDATHLPELLRKEWLLIRDLLGVGTIVCFDDAHTEGFIDWMRDNTNKWVYKIANENKSPQLWLEKIDD